MQNKKSLVLSPLAINLDVELLARPTLPKDYSQIISQSN